MTLSAPRQRPDPSRSAAICALLPGLAEPRERIEATFVAIGDRLTRGATMLNRITRVFEALPRNLESPELLEASDKLAAIAREAGVISAAFAVEQSDLARLVAVVAAADHPISDLRRTVKMMGIVAINARVVAAGVVGNSDDFDVFTTDIAKLSDSAHRTIQDFSTLYRQLTEEVRRAAEQREHFEGAHADTLSGLATSMGDTLAAVTLQRQASVGGSAETGRVSRQIAGRIGNAVMALQVGDSTRQRIEHVEAGLAVLAELVDGSAAAGVCLPEAEREAAIALIAQLQTAQLASAADAFEADIGEATKALQALAADAATIMLRSRDIYGQPDAGGRSSLAALSTQLRHAVAVLADCEAERSKLEKVAGAVQGTVQSLLGHVEAVQEIEANMRLVSLNAAVKCAQLGPRGTALNVIARQLRELTEETVKAAEAAMSGLSEAAGLARSFGAASRGEATAQIGNLEQQANTALTLLETVDGTLAEAFAVLNQDGPNVISLLGEAADNFADQGAIGEALDDVHVAMAALSADRPGAPDVKLDAVLDVLRSKYTMDGERRIHDAMFKRSAGTQKESEPVEAELDDIFL